MNTSENGQRPSLAIIIVNWNSYNVTAPCLASIRSLNYSNYEVVLVDNGSEDGSGEDLKKNFPEIIFLKNEKNLGFTGGNNTGIRYAIDQHFDLIMLLNNDTIIDPSFASTLIDTLENDKSIGAIQPKILYNQERNIIWNAGGELNQFFFLTKPIGLDEKDIGQYDQPKEVDWITGCCFLVRTEIISKIGPLDDKFFIYYEDSDWSFKIRLEGHKLWYEPSAKIYHEVGMSNRNRSGHNEGNISPFTRYQIIRNHFFMVRRYSKGFNKIGAYSNQILKVSMYMAYFLIRGRFQKLKAVYKGVIDGLTM